MSERGGERENEGKCGRGRGGGKDRSGRADRRIKGRVGEEGGDRGRRERDRERRACLLTYLSLSLDKITSRWDYLSFPLHATRTIIIMCYVQYAHYLSFSMLVSLDRSSLATQSVCMNG